MGKFVKIGDQLIRKDSILSVKYTGQYEYPYKVTQIEKQAAENVDDSPKSGGFLGGLFKAVTALNAVTGALSGDYSFEIKQVRFLEVETETSTGQQYFLLYNDADFAESIADIVETGQAAIGKMRNANGASDYERACYDFISHFNATFCCVDQNLEEILNTIEES